MEQSLVIAVPKDNGAFEVLRLTAQESESLRIVFETQDFAKACAETGVAAQRIRELVANDAVRNHIQRVIVNQYKSAQLDEARVRATVHDALTRTEKHIAADDIGKEDVSIMNLAADVTGAKKQRLDLNIRAVNPYSKLTDEEFNALVAERERFAQSSPTFNAQTTPQSP